MTEPVAVKRALWPFVSKIRRRKRSRRSVFVAVAAVLACMADQLGIKGELGNGSREAMVAAWEPIIIS